MFRYAGVGYRLVAIAVVGGASFLATAQGADEVGDRAKPTTFWMQKKLDYSQEMLAGITIADFDRVTAAAEKMRTLSKVEAFVRARSPAYRDQLKEFQSSNEEILRQAEEKNIDGAAAALSRLTSSCIRCHKVLRDQSTK